MVNRDRGDCYQVDFFLLNITDGFASSKYMRKNTAILEERGLQL